MPNKLQELTDKLYNEDLSKGKQEGEEILANAKVQADDRFFCIGVGAYLEKHAISQTF
jgi:hypothetical protein